MAVLNEEQTMLLDAAKGWVADSMPITAFRQLRDGGSTLGYDPAAYKAMADMGWTGIVIPEAYGGSEFGYLSLGIVLEQLGRNVAAHPLAATALASSAIVLGGSDAQKQAWLPKLAAGEVVGTLAIDEASTHTPDKIAATATKTGGGWTLSGKKLFVPEGDGAGLFVVAAQLDGGVELFLVPADAPGVSRKHRAMADARSHADVTFTNVALSADAKLEGGAALFDKVLDHARAATAAEMLGLASAAFDITLDYLKQRVQFGQVIGTFQALQHRAAELFTQIELMRSAVEGALEAIDAKRADLAQAASLSKAVASDTLHLMSREMIQLHGGIGMTDDYIAGFYIKRARALENQWGNAGFHRERFARLNGY